MRFDLQENINKAFDKINFADNKINLQKNKKIIWDKTCPKCKNMVSESDYCLCGYSLAADRSAKLWGIVIFTWLFIIGFIFIFINSFVQFNEIIYKKLETNSSNFYLLSPVNVQVVSSLKTSKYKDYILSVYVDPESKNKLKILIKPVYWNILSGKEKNELKKIILKKWIEIYKNISPESKLKPEVQLSNFE